jgi:SAM-dependent methyltransferase
MIQREARVAVGVDVEAPQGGEIIRGDMESCDLGRRFEVVVAGDVIEHVSNQVLFLQNIHRHLTDDGILVLTTPNAKWPTVFLRPNETHTLWHDQFTLRHTLQRAGFVIHRLVYYPGNKPSYPWWIRPLLWRQQILVMAGKG